MKWSIREQLFCIQEHDAPTFQRKMNEILSRTTSPRIEMDRNVPFTAYVFYRCEMVEPETIADTYELRGEGKTCAACPLLERPETAHARQATFKCKYSEYGITKLSSPACDHYYHAMEEGLL